MQCLRCFANRRIPSLQAAVVFVFTSIVLVLAPTSWADDEADAIINKGIKAIGGEARLAQARVTTSKVKSTVISGDNESVAEVEHTADGLDRMRSTAEQESDGNKFTTITVINGKKGWLKIIEMRVIELEGDEVADQKLQSAPLALLELKDSKFKTEAVDDVKVDGKPAAGVKVIGPEGKGFTIYFDKQTGLPVKSVADQPDPESPGQVFTQETYYSDYQDFGGIKQATKVEIKGGGTFIKMELMDFKVLDKVDEKTFAKPA
ncbi:MAG TPA: hypothetical protein VHB99_11535 [Pirellulales bacterium]|nr:hypothetical protein [Pirellulales bacterium]